LSKGIATDILDKVCTHYADDMAKWILQKIIKDIDQYKKRGLQWLDIIQKLMRKWYRTDQIKDAIKLRDGQ
jgi:hypothetical protein